MNRSLASVLVASLLAAVAALSRAPFPAQPAAPTTSVEGTKLLSCLPVAFVPNAGQWQTGASYLARCGPLTALLDPHGWVLGLCASANRDLPARSGTRQDPEPAVTVRSASVRMSFRSSQPAVLFAEDRLAGVHHYFLSGDRARWRTDVPRFGAVRYRGLYPGVDLRAYSRNGHFEYDLCLAPGADLARVEVRVEGAGPLRIDGDGALILETEAGPLRQPPPLTYAIDGQGTRREVAGKYELRDSDCFGFSVPSWDGASELVLDPELLYSTFLGGSWNDSASALSVDAAGVVTVAGTTWSPDLRTTPGAWDSTLGGQWDVFVACLDQRLPRSQQLVYSTFLGGADRDWVTALAVDSTGVATVAGYTASSDFPTSPGAWDTVLNGSSKSFVTRLDPRQSGAQQLVYSTFLGGSLFNEVYALAVDAAGVATVAGVTTSPDFPTTPGAFDASFAGGPAYVDAFVTRIDPSLPGAQQLVYSTFLGGSGFDRAFALSVDTAGVVTVTGLTSSPTFPTTPGAWSTTHGGSDDAFVTRLDPRLTGAQQLAYSTFLGGSNWEVALAVSVDAAGVVTVVGNTDSADFPTTANAWDTSHNGQGDAFVARLDPRLPAAGQLVYATFLGGSSREQAAALSVDANGAVTLAGSTSSSDFPTTRGAWNTAFSGGLSDAFVARLDPRLPAAEQLLYATFLGGSGGEGTTALSVDAEGVATVAGATQSSDYPTTPSGWNTTHNGGSGGTDAFVTRLGLLPAGVSRFGVSSPGCMGPLAIGVTSMPRIGNATFTLTCSNAPPNSGGLVLLTGAGLTAPLPVLGIDLWVNPARLWALPSVPSDTRGASYLPLPVPPDQTLIGGRLHAQFVWPGPTAPAPCPVLGWSASNALVITMQP